jgi:hypothetical protein
VRLLTGIMPALRKLQLERICVYALNKLQREQHVRVVKVEPAPSGPANWTLKKVEPRLALVDVKKSYEVIRTLQREYQLGTLAHPLARAFPVAPKRRPGAGVGGTPIRSD